MKPSSVFNRSINYLVNASKINKSSMNKSSIQLVRVTNSTQNLTTAKKEISWPLQTVYTLTPQNQFSANQHLQTPIATSPIYEIPRPQSMSILQAISAYSDISVKNNSVQSAPQPPSLSSLKRITEAQESKNPNLGIQAESIYLTPDDEHIYDSPRKEPNYQNVPNQPTDNSLDPEAIYDEPFESSDPSIQNVPNQPTDNAFDVEPIYLRILDQPADAPLDLEPIYETIPDQPAADSLDTESIYATISDQAPDVSLDAEPIYDDPFEPGDPSTQNVTSETINSMIKKGLIKSKSLNDLPKNTTENSEQRKTPSSAKSIILPSGNNTESDS